MGSTIHQIYDAEVAVAVNSSGYEKSARKVANSTKQLTNRLKLRANINQPVRALGKLNTKVKSTTRSIVRSLTSLVAAGGLIAFAKQSVEVGRNLNAMRSLSKQVFPSMQDDLEKWAQAAGSTYALSERMALKYASQLGAMAEAMGFSEKEAYQMSTTLTGLAGDVASFYSITQDEAYTKLRSVFSGESEPLKDLGVVMTQTNLDAYALSHGFNKTTKEMTQTELATLRYQYVLYSLSNAQGDVLRTSQSFGVKLRFIKLNFENLMATIGQGIINILLPLMDVLNKIIARLQVVANAFRAWTERFKQVSPAAKFIKGLGGADKSAKKLGDTAGGASDSADALGDSLEGAGDDAKKAAKKMKQAQRDIMGFDQINKITKQQESEGTSGSAGTTTGAGFSMGDLYSDADADATAEGFAEKLKKALQKRNWSDIGTELADKIAEALKKIPWTDIQEKVATIASNIADFLNGFLGSSDMWSETGGAIAEAINTALIGAKTLFQGLDWTEIGKAIGDGFNNFVAKLDVKTAAETLSSLATGILNFFTGAISQINWTKVGESIIDFFLNIKWADLFKSAVSLATSIVNGVYDLLTGAIGKAAEWVKNGGVSNAIEFTVSILKSGLDWVWNLVKKLADLIGKVNDLTFKITVELIKKGAEALFNFLGLGGKEFHVIGVDLHGSAGGAVVAGVGAAGHGSDYADSAAFGKVLHAVLTQLPPRGHVEEIGFGLGAVRIVLGTAAVDRYRKTCN